jgi:deoxyribodipyrimidine photo-lyase
LVESLVDVDKNLRQRGARLLLLEGDSSVSITSLLTQLTQRGYAPTLYKNRDRMGYKVLERETAVETFCNQNDITIYTGSAYFLLSPQQSYENWIKHYYEYQEATEWKTPDQLYNDNNLNEVAAELPHITADELVPWVVEIMGQVKRAGPFVGGETEAQRTLASFLRSRYHGYHWKLSRPYLAEHGATSQLSPHIAFGTISTRHINSKAYAMKQRLKIDAPDEVRTLASFLSRLRWRDSFTQRYALHPELKWHNAYPEFDVIYTAEPLQGVYKQRFEHWKDDRFSVTRRQYARTKRTWLDEFSDARPVRYHADDYFWRIMASWR